MVPAAAHDHDHDAQGPDDQGGEGGNGGCARDGAGDIPEQTVDTAAEHLFLPGLRHVGLHHPDPTQPLGKPAGDLRVDLPALPEDGPQPPERERHPAAEDHQDHQHRQCHGSVEGEEDHRRGHGREEPADEIDDPGPHQVPDPFGIAHDPGDEHPGLGGVEVGYGEMDDVLLNRLAHLGDGALPRHAHDPGQAEAGAGLDQRGQGGHARQREQQLHPALPQHIVDQELGRPGQHQARDPVQDHEPHADGQ
jgi:hypothetical protein